MRSALKNDHDHEGIYYPRICHLINEDGDEYNLERAKRLTGMSQLDDLTFLYELVGLLACKRFRNEFSLSDDQAKEIVFVCNCAAPGYSGDPGAASVIFEDNYE